MYVSFNRSMFGGAVFWVASVLSFACTRGEGREQEGNAKSAAGSASATPGGTSTAPADSVAKGAAVTTGGAGGAGGRGPRVLTLAPTDVKSIERGTVEGGPAISGNL